VKYAQAHPQVVLALWTLCLGLALALVFTMLADIQEVEDRLSQREHDIWREFARIVASKEKRSEDDQEDEKKP
jgi:hypothetical protein